MVWGLGWVVELRRTWRFSECGIMGVAPNGLGCQLKRHHFNLHESGSFPDFQNMGLHNSATRVGYTQLAPS